jgi:hypothetical protein
MKVSTIASTMDPLLQAHATYSNDFRILTVAANPNKPAGDLPAWWVDWML